MEAAGRQAGGATVGELRGDQDLRQVVQEAVDRATAKCPAPRASSGSGSCDAEFAVGAELTPTQKVRRDYVLAAYAADVDALYA